MTNSSPCHSPSFVTTPLALAFAAALASAWRFTRSAWVVKYCRLWPLNSAMRLEVVLGHEAEQLVLHALDAVVAELHDAGADLHGVAAEEDELGGVLAALDAADAR